MGQYEGQVRPYRFQCRAGLTVAGIRHTGGITACPELPAAFDQGHIERQRLREVWETQYQVFRDRSWTRRGICAHCQAYDACQGGSLHLYEHPQGEVGRCFYNMLGQG